MMQPTEHGKGPARRRSSRRTRPSVRWIDAVARNVIRIGGIGTIAAISTVFVFLLWVVWPLLRSETVAAPRELSAGASNGGPVALGEEGVVAIAPGEALATIQVLTGSGRLVAFAGGGGPPLSEASPLGAPPTAFALPLRSSQGVAGFADGTVRFVRLEGHTEYRAADSIPEELRSHPAGERFLLNGSVAERVTADRFMLYGATLAAEEVLPVAPGAAIRAIDLSLTSAGPAFASVDANGVLRVTQVSKRQNFMTGLEEIDAESGELLLAAVASRGIPRWVMLRGLGDNALAVWEDGHAVRVDVRRLAAPVVVEELDLVPEEGVRVTALAFANGKNTLLVGDSSGRLRAWFRIPAPRMATGDGAHFVAAHDLGTGPAAVSALAPSPRTRLVAGERVVAETRSKGRISVAAMLADDSAIVAWREGSAGTAPGFEAFAVDAPHPEVSLRSLLRPVFYEGYPAPAHVWQSSSGSDDFEPKLGLWPLVFGTLKATLYSMLFGVPIALAAAVYTSEFLRPEVKAVVKPAIEMMASLPSVVLGFLAALVLAPLVEQAVPEVLASVVLVPYCLVLGAQLWQFVPRGRRTGMQGGRLPLAAASICGGLALSFFAGSALERALFDADFRQWLDDPKADPTGGLLLLTLPATAVCVAALVGRIPLVKRVPPAAQSMLRFLGGSAVTVAIAFATASALASAGADIRGIVVGTYVQRNALVVGFVMAFAIIPIVYTIAEDALSSIPENLRAGSLALGATPWQTAMRIVVPTAMSGLFSAVMIGLGRAVGETMIVLMAAGNTPVLEWNLFNGFRTLSANIAVELPEAVRNGTHYRTLFLAAFTLFVMTFVLNTAAELVRSRFRRRARQL
jgi:phosphate transport system permease protein